MLNNLKTFFQPEVGRPAIDAYTESKPEEDFAPDEIAADKIQQRIEQGKREREALLHKADELKAELAAVRRDITLPEQEAHKKVMELDTLIVRNSTLQVKKKDQLDELELQRQEAVAVAHSVAAAKFDSASRDAMQEQLNLLESCLIVKRKLEDLRVISGRYGFSHPTNFFDRNNSYLNHYSRNSDLESFELEQRLASFRQLIAGNIEKED